ncbi:MAG: pentapeptide repeat-containing protein [Halobacteriales archaeon]|nr:pentapeptide repeat-containing protein [Halobacteriales archaeon]
MTDICEYVFDPEEDNGDGRPGTSLDFVWECPHPTYVDTDYCTFHLAHESREILGVTEVEVRDSLLRTVEATESGEPCRFIGATFGETVIDSEVLGENTDVIDLRNTEFDGRFELDCDVVESDILLDYSEFERFVAPNVVFEGDVSFVGCRFEGRVNLDGAKFKGNVSFEEASFALNAEFSDTVFEGDVDFRRSNYSGVKTTFKGAVFEGEVLMNSTNFDKVDFTGAEFYADADFTGAVFKNEAKFQYAKFGTVSVFENADFNGNSTFRGVKFLGYADFRDVSFQGWVSFLNVKFDRDACFESVWFKSELNMVAESENNAVIDFSGARMGKASFEIEPYKPVILDFTKARIGNVRLSMEGKVNNPFDNVRFIETKFNGFRFSEYADYLAETNYVIHDSVVKKDENLSASSLEKTYRLAADGAKGNARDIASKFAKKEAKYRRERYRSEGQALNYYVDIFREYGLYALILVVIIGVAVVGYVYLDEIQGMLP